ncbi:hypothetical protein M758_UG170700 [Ceratodon purpureus]|nr:hypothetical protein M758_UG170700 [Ceratodon purpureus]
MLRQNHWDVQPLSESTPWANANLTFNVYKHRIILKNGNVHTLLGSHLSLDLVSLNKSSILDTKATKPSSVRMRPAHEPGKSLFVHVEFVPDEADLLRLVVIVLAPQPSDCLPCRQWQM